MTLSDLANVRWHKASSCLSATAKLLVELTVGMGQIDGQMDEDRRIKDKVVKQGALMQSASSALRHKHGGQQRWLLARSTLYTTLTEPQSRAQPTTTAPPTSRPPFQCLSVGPAPFDLTGLGARQTTPRPADQVRVGLHSVTVCHPHRRFLSRHALF